MANEKWSEGINCADCKYWYRPLKKDKDGVCTKISGKNAEVITPPDFGCKKFEKGKYEL